jgi:hypothetical protein
LQNIILAYEKNVNSNTIHINNYCIFCDQNASFFFFFSNPYSSFKFSRYKFLLYFSCLKKNYHNLFILFRFMIFISFSSLMHILCPNFGYCINHLKKLASILCLKCGYYKIRLTELMFILWLHIEPCVYWSYFCAIMQYCNMFQTWLGGGEEDLESNHSLEYSRWDCF